MLKLKNLRKTENTMEADFYPEDSKESGHIIVSLDTEDIISHTAPVGYEKNMIYAAHARQALIKLAAQNILPENYTVMWY